MYIASLVITLFGTGATLLIMDVAQSVDPEVAGQGQLGFLLPDAGN